MRSFATGILGLFALSISPILASNSAAAGDYYGGGYRSSGNVWYSSSCCYRKVVKHVRKVSYVRADNGYRDGYYAPRYRNSYYDRPYRSTVYREPNRGNHYYGPSYRYSGSDYYGGGDGYRVYRSSYNDHCTTRRVLVADGYGGWVWSRSRTCY